MGNEWKNPSRADLWIRPGCFRPKGIARAKTCEPAGRVSLGVGRCKHGRNPVPDRMLRNAVVVGRPKSSAQEQTSKTQCTEHVKGINLADGEAQKDTRPAFSLPRDLLSLLNL